MYKLTIKNGGEYYGLELPFDTVTEAALVVEEISAHCKPGTPLEYHIVPVKREGEDQ